MTKKKKYRAGRGRQRLALLVILCLIGTMMPVQIKAQENGLPNGVCEHHTEHTADCGYQQAVQEHACGHVHDETCGYQQAQDCTHEHDGICGYIEAVEGSPCTYVCDICSGQNKEEEAAKMELLTEADENAGKLSANLSASGGNSERIVLSVGSVGYTEADIANSEDNIITINGEGITKDSVTYDKQNKILTLNNATISTYVDNASNINGNIGIYTEFDLTIKLIGKNVIKDQNPVREKDNYGIRALWCNLTITGEGTLEVTSAYTDSWSSAILADGDITFNGNCKVKAVSEAAKYRSIAIWSFSNSIIVDKGCVIEASCKSVEMSDGTSVPICYYDKLQLTSERMSVAKYKAGSWAGVPATEKLEEYSYVKIEPASLYLPSLYEFSLSKLEQEITVKNTTDQEISGLTVTFEGEDKDYFTATPISTSIPANGGEAKFTVSVNQNLPLYDETFNNAIVKVSSQDGSISASAGLELVIVYSSTDPSPETPNLSGTTLRDTTYTKGATAAPLTINASVSDGGTLTYRWATGSTEAPTYLTAQTTNPTFVPPTDTVGAVTYFCEVTNTRNGSWVTKTSPMVTITVVEGSSGNNGNDENNGNSGAVQNTAKSTTEIPVNASTYQIIEGAEVVWKPGSSEDCTIRGNGEFSKFTGVKMDGILIEGNNYTAREGSTIITLQNAYLKTLAAGTHTIEIVWTDGSAATTITVNAKDAVPKTGESTTAVWLFALTGLSGMGLLLIEMCDRKNKKAIRKH